MQQHPSQAFADREAELAFLERKHSEAAVRLTIIYGRRRVGKMFLIPDGQNLGAEAGWQKELVF